MAQGSHAVLRLCRGGLLIAAVLATVGCLGKDKDKTDTGMRNLDPRVKAALTSPDGSKPATKFATGDPSATGMKDLSASNSFNRTKTNPQGTPTSTASLTPPAAGAPTTPNNPAVMTPQPAARNIEQARFEAAPPVKPLELGGPLPVPNMSEVVASGPLTVPLSDPTPKELPSMPPIITAGPVPNPFPPVAPIPVSPAPILPAAPADSGLIILPSPNEKPVTDFPIVPPMIK